MIDEGVVKYSLEFIPSESVEVEYMTQIEQVRADLFALGLIGAYEESGIGYGNISQKFDGSDFEFVITGTQTGDLAHLESKHYSKITGIDFTNFTTYATGATKPSSEAITHATIYKISPKIKAVIHIHNEKLWRYMLANEYLSTNDVPYGSPEMVEDIENIYQDINALQNPLFVMLGHFEGIVIFGESLQSAKEGLYRLLGQYLSG